MSPDIAKPRRGESQNDGGQHVGKAKRWEAKSNDDDTRHGRVGAEHTDSDSLAKSTGDSREAVADDEAEAQGPEKIDGECCQLVATRELNHRKVSADAAQRAKRATERDSDNRPELHSLRVVPTELA